MTLRSKALTNSLSSDDNIVNSKNNLMLIVLRSMKVKKRICKQEKSIKYSWVQNFDKAQKSWLYF